MDEHDSTSSPGSATPSRPRLVLVGAGHAHMSVLRHLILGERSDLDVTVISATPVHHYSGMVPGYLSGAYREDELTFDTEVYVRLARASFVLARATRIDLPARIVETDDGRRVAYDLASINIGSLTAGTDTPGVAEHAVSVKPMALAAVLRQRILDMATPSGVRARVVVVGGGSAAVEVAWAVDAALAAGGRARDLSIVEAGSTLLADYAPRVRGVADRLLIERRIAVLTRTRAVEVAADYVRCDDGRRLPSDLTIWLTGPAASPLFQASGLSTDARGFFLVDSSLRSIDDPRVFGAGDCATMADHPETPKAGVYAVRQAPHLWTGLTAALDGRSPSAYVPQRGFLSILNTADGKALLRYRGFVSHSRWAWWLKDRIDRRFVALYHDLVPGPTSSA